MTEDKPKTQVKGHCPTCAGVRNADVVAFYREFDSDDQTWTNNDHGILRCAGCGTVYYKKVATFSEDYYHVDDPSGEHGIEYDETITYFPAPTKRARPKWVGPWQLNSTLYKLLDQTYNALNSDARTLAGIGIRTVFDKASEILEVDPAISFQEKIVALFDKGKIGADERQHLELLTHAGNAAAHRGWEPTVEEFSALMDIMEAFLYRTFVLNKDVKKIKDSIPAKQKRQKKTAADVIPHDTLDKT